MIDNDLVSEINNALQVQNYDLSLELYARLFSENIAIDIAKQHKINAANLARKKLYDELSNAANGITRLQTAIDTLIGLKPFSYENTKQQPNFFYIPGLTAKPFWELSDFPDLEGLCAELKAMLEVSGKELTHTDPYISNSDTVPESKEWDVLKKSWHQTVLLKGGEIKVSPKTNQFDVAQMLLNNPLVADCPPRVHI
jgi:hypothetical protein